MDEQEYIFDLGGCSVDEVCAVIQSYVDTNEDEVSCDFDTRNSHYAKIEFSLSSAWHGFASFDQLTSYNEQEQYSTMTLLTLHGKTTLRITPVVGDWLVFKPHVDKIIAHLLPASGESVTRQLWRLKGTIDELKAELKSSHVAHRPIGPDGPAYYKIDIGNYEIKQRQPTISAITYDGYTFFPRGVQDRPRGKPAQRPVKEVSIEFVQEGDSLRMTVTIDDDVTPDLYADIHERWAMLKAHLEKHRGLVPYGQTVERQPVGAQTKEQPDPEINEPDQWLIKQFFDIHQEKRGLPYFRDEWLRRREENDMNPLVNVGDSMRQVTKKERERRRMKKHE